MLELKIEFIAHCALSLFIYFTSGALGPVKYFVSILSFWGECFINSDCFIIENLGRLYIFLTCFTVDVMCDS